MPSAFHKSPGETREQTVFRDTLGSVLLFSVSLPMSSVHWPTKAVRVLYIHHMVLQR